MNVTVNKTIDGHQVAARPVFKGGVVPAYWTAVVDRHTLARVFSSPQAVFSFVRKHDYQSARP